VKPARGLPLGAFLCSVVYPQSQSMAISKEVFSGQAGLKYEKSQRLLKN
jgi:hypothetical protein